MSEKEMMEKMMQQLETLSQQQVQLVGHISSLRSEMHEEMGGLKSDIDSLKRLVDGQGEVLASVVEQLGEISEELKDDLHDVEHSAYKTAADVAKLKLLK